MFKFISILIIYLMIVSSALGFVITEKTQSDFNSLNTITYESDTIDFSGDTELTDISSSGILSHSAFYLENNTLIYGGIATNPIRFEGISPVDEIYSVEYNINNIDHLSYDIYVTSGGLQDADSIIVRYENTGRLIIYKPYFHSVVGDFLKEEIQSINVNLVGLHSIKTELDTNDGWLTIYVDGDKQMHVPVDLKDDYDSYAGILPQGTGDFVINSINTHIVVSDTSEDDGIFKYISTITKILTWQVDSKYLPTEFNIILIDLPLLLLGLSIAFFIRGVN